MGGHPIVLDFATVVIAEGKVRVARATGKSVEPKAIIDSEGRPSITPDDFYTGVRSSPLAPIRAMGSACSSNYSVERSPVTTHR